jgi:hypothetical protein
MKAYIDAGLLLSVLVHTDYSAEASGILRRLPGPLTLNYLHQLQAENFLHHRAKRLPDAWWDGAFRLAIEWSRNEISAPAPLLLLHPALAVMSEATHFASFDARSRKVAKSVGLKLLPATL